ncbi:MAG: response regulator transcription factor, partial [Verrucomicrobiota bacterium]
MTATRILIADDHIMFRQGLGSLIRAHRNYEVVAEASDGREAVELAEQRRPDIILMDISMPRLNGMDATTQILKQNKAIKIIALSMHREASLIGRMLESGASGFILKDSAFEEVEKAIETVLGGHIYLAPEITTILVRNSTYLKDGSTGIREVRFTPREREVLQLISEGHSTKEIATELGISQKTI